MIGELASASARDRLSSAPGLDGAPGPHRELFVATTISLLIPLSPSAPPSSESPPNTERLTLSSLGQSAITVAK